MATPILQDLRTQFKEAKITVLAQGNVASILSQDPHVDEVIGYKKPSGWTHKAEHWDVIDLLQIGKYDLGILLTNSFSSAWWFFRGKVKERVGFATNLRSFLLTKAVPFPKELKTQHLVLTYKELLTSLGIPVSNTAPTLYLGEEERQYARQFVAVNDIGKKDIIVGINPGAAYGTAKCWLPERFREVTEELLQTPNLVVIYFGDNGSRGLIQEICKGLPPKRVIDMAGKTSLRELISLISICSTFLTNDSGPMHIASALKIPLVALFGSTSDVRTGPYNGGEVIHKRVECSPCYKRVCPIDFKCMKQITSQEVYEKLSNLVQK